MNALPATFRIVCEGDVVTGVPRVHCGRCTVCDWISPRCYGGNFCGLHEYSHLGTPVFLPRKGLGDLLVSLKRTKNENEKQNKTKAIDPE